MEVDIYKIVEEENKKYSNQFIKNIEKLREINKTSHDFNTFKENKNFYDFFYRYSEFLLKIVELDEKFNVNYFKNSDFNTLLEENNSIYEELDDDKYETSFLNPEYSVKQLGDNFGQLFSFLASKCRYTIATAYHHLKFVFVKNSDVFIDAYNYIDGCKELNYEELKKIITSDEGREKVAENIIRNLKTYSPDFTYYKDIIEEARGGDIKYLLRYDCKITDSEIKIAKFLQNYPDEKLKKVAQIMVDAYFKSFENRNKIMGKRNVVQLMFDVGFEKLVFYLMQELKNRELLVAIGSVMSSKVNPQYGYDHRFDSALYFDEKYCDFKEKEAVKVFEIVKDKLKYLSGVIAFMNFGEAPFDFKNKEVCLKFSDKQQELMKDYQNKMMEISDRYISMKDISQSCIGFPKPEIGDKFEEIFEATFDINMLDTNVYEAIQQKIIDILDEGDHVHVKGKGDNRTDIRVKLQELNPEKETNFINCGCDLNIPVGEVFTSPNLKGTNGILHVDDTFLFGKKYINLELEFKDGFVTEYNCSNYDSEEENKKYVEEGLLFPHKTLPLGEFAIGTNTLAYVTGRKFDIMEKLPILIIEKMGPHFAIGDTCFFMDEDNLIQNRYNKKTFIAAENEKSRLRKEDISKAYTFRHTDITLPYELIEFITVVKRDGSKEDIIRNGRFVVPGTEELNKPLDEYFGKNEL